MLLFLKMLSGMANNEDPHQIAHQFVHANLLGALVYEMYEILEHVVYVTCTDIL